MRAGFAAEDGAALHFVDTELRRVVASRPAARGYGLALGEDGVAETALETDYLGDPKRGSRSSGSTHSAVAA